MSCSQCIGIENEFDKKHAAGELRRYQRNGPRPTTLALIDQVASLGVDGRTVIDIRGGVGAAHFGLLAAGARAATDVDASSEYLRTAREEAARRGLGDRITHHHGNFIDLAADIPAADIVTLDRVICCYDDAKALLESAAQRAKSVLGLVHPRDTPLSRFLNRLLNLMQAVQGTDYRSFVHPQEQIDSVVQSKGFENRSRVKRGFWQVSVYARRARG